MTTGKRAAITGFILLQALLVSSLLLAQTPGTTKSATEAKFELREGWSLQTSAKVEAKGEVISTSRFAPTGWHAATVPTTVVAALVKDKTFPDPLFGTNLRDFAGVTYPIGANFSNIPMAPDSPYAVSWWYRK
jgi:exo-1,4-beta-D-glucosaminidase